MNTPLKIQTLPIPPEDMAFEQVRLRFVRLIPGDPKRELVPAYHFHIVAADDGANIGHLNFRVGDTEHIRVCAGHIGYQVHPEYRGHGYALQACNAITPFVRLFYDAVTITCDPDNRASIRTIERLGASFLDEVPVPPQDPHYLRGSRSKRRYQWTP